MFMTVGIELSVQAFPLERVLISSGFKVSVYINGPHSVPETHTGSTAARGLFSQHHSRAPIKLFAGVEVGRHLPVKRLLLCTVHLFGQTRGEEFAGLAPFYSQTRC